jgi:hypothetical protein
VLATQRFDGELAEDDCPATSRRLRRRLHPATADPLASTLHVDETRFPVDITPPQRSDLAEPQSGAEDEEHEWRTRVGTGAAVLGQPSECVTAGEFDAARPVVRRYDQLGGTLAATSPSGRHTPQHAG